MGNFVAMSNWMVSAQRTAESVRLAQEEVDAAKLTLAAALQTLQLARQLSTAARSGLVGAYVHVCNTQTMLGLVRAELADRAFKLRPAPISLAGADMPCECLR